MIYFISEDTNSAYDFWSRVLQSFNVEGQVLKFAESISSGNTSLLQKIEAACKTMNAGDTLFLAIDNIETTAYFDLADFLHRVKVMCQQYNIQLQFTKYYCFEEIYLRYPELLQMYSVNYKQDPLILKVLKFVQTCIQNNINYFDMDNEDIAQLIDKFPSACKNREHFANVLLMESTRYLSGHFSITKSIGTFDNAGECWLKDCSIIQNKMPSQQITVMCSKQCNYCCKHQTAKDKIYDLFKDQSELIAKLGFHEELSSIGTSHEKSSNINTSPEKSSNVGTPYLKQESMNSFDTK